MSQFNDKDLIDFGPLPEAVNDLLQRGVALYRHDAAAADRAFHDALALDPSALPAYFCLYKIHTYQGSLDKALAVAKAGLSQATRQAGLPDDWTAWERGQFTDAHDPATRFALYTLKALSFIHLKRGDAGMSGRCLHKLEQLGQLDAVGGAVVADLQRAVGS
jgi:hypothetical protein